MNENVESLEDQSQADSLELLSLPTLLKELTPSEQTTPSRQWRVHLSKRVNVDAMPPSSTANPPHPELYPHLSEQWGRVLKRTARTAPFPLPLGFRLYLDRFQVLQKFEGVVQSVTENSFVARLTDKTHDEHEEAEFHLEEVSPGDRNLVMPGAEFYWVIGREVKPYGQISRSSILRFKRIPAWSNEEVEQAKAEAETFLSFVDLDAGNDPS
ncbi:MAG: hypothetical protein ABSC89_00020 [Verrucomicrobiota bacterium]|jgi:hypothetical protein